MWALITIVLLLVALALTARAVWKSINDLWDTQLTAVNRTWQRDRANQRRKRVERALRRERRKNEMVVRNMAIRHGQVLAELEKAHEDLDQAEERYKTLAAQTAELLPAHEERQTLSLFKENT